LLREVVALPEEYDGLKPYCEYGQFDQDGIGACVGMDGKGAIQTTNWLLDNIPDEMSSWWLYQRSRFYAMVPPGVEGSTNIGLMKALNHEGCVLESRYPMPTNVDKVYPINPTEDDYAEAKLFSIDSYWYVNLTPNDFKAAIYGVTHPAPYKMPDGSPGKIPLVTAFPVYESYKDSTDDGIVPMPHPDEQLMGGHSSQIRGWKKIDGKEYWINTNSWGKDVGDNGTFYMPIDYPFYDAWIIHNGAKVKPWWCWLLGWLPWFKAPCSG